MTYIAEYSLASIFYYITREIPDLCEVIMLKEGKSIDNYESQSLVAKPRDNRFNSTSPTFILCGKCYWCATLIRLDYLYIISCQRCNTDNNNELSVFFVVPK
jgi:hypothetical protein